MTTILSNGGDGGTGGTGGTGGEPNQFLATLPEELRADASLKDIKDVGGLAKSYVNSQKMLGSRIPLLTDKSTPEERAEFYTKLGRPAKPEDYAFKDDGLPKEIFGREEILKTMRATMFEHGLSKAAAEQIFEKYSETMNKHVELIRQQDQERRAAGVATLKTEFGTEFDKNVAIAKSAVTKFAPPEFVALLDKTGLGDDPAVVKTFLAIGKAISGDTIEGGGAGGGGGSGSAADAQAKIKAMETDPETRKALTDPTNPKHKVLAAERSRLFAIAYPGAQQVIG